MNSELIISVVYETKWCMRILLATDLKINRFNQIHIYLGISRSVLARNLNLLIRSELIKKQTIANSHNPKMMATDVCISWEDSIMS